MVRYAGIVRLLYPALSIVLRFGRVSYDRERRNLYHVFKRLGNLSFDLSERHGVDL